MLHLILPLHLLDPPKEIKWEEVEVVKVDEEEEVEVEEGGKEEEDWGPAGPTRQQRRCAHCPAEQHNSTDCQTAHHIIVAVSSTYCMAYEFSGCCLEIKAILKKYFIIHLFYAAFFYFIYFFYLHY